MNTPWIGSRKIAVIPAVVNDPIFTPPPANWADQIRQRIFYDPDPVSGVDRSLRAYFHTVSYGKALLEADILDPVAVPWTHCSRTQDDAINATPNAQNYEYACVVFPRAATGRNPCAGWAFYNNSPFNFNPARNGNVLRNWCYVSMDVPLGVWAMEVLHMLTWFGDLYLTSREMSPHPGNFDNMACSCGTQLSTFTKLKLNWLDPSTVQSITTSGTSDYTLHAVALLQPAPPGRTTAIRIPENSQHYFLVEVRLRSDHYEQATPGVSVGIPSEGVVIYEVDETVWAPVRLLTQVALSPNQNYIDPNGRFEVRGVAAVPGGFTINVQAHLHEAAGDSMGYRGIFTALPLVGSIRANRVVYRGHDNHIHTLYLTDQWYHFDITANTNAPLAAGDPMGYTSGNADRVVYRGQDNHVHELYLDLTQRWQYFDITAGLGAPLVASDPRGYIGNNAARVVYRGQNNHVHELYLTNQWNHFDMTANTNSELAVGNPMGYMDSNISRVVYRGQDDHVHELYLTNQWNHFDMISGTQPKVIAIGMIVIASINLLLVLFMRAPF